MDTLILSNAKHDIPLYLQEFNSFWLATVRHYIDNDLLNCYANTLIFKNWQISLNHINIQKLDSILIEIHEDINSSFYLAMFGQYRSSHMHLRSVIELSLQLLYFLQHEVEFSQWLNADFRIKHEELTNYLKKHPNLVGSSAIASIDIITRSWKLFSKYIHAEAPSYFQTTLQSSQTKEISIRDFNIWKSNFLKTGYLLNKIFLIFFRSQINLFPTQSRDILTRNLTSDDLRELGFA